MYNPPFKKSLFFQKGNIHYYKHFLCTRIKSFIAYLRIWVTNKDTFDNTGFKFIKMFMFLNIEISFVVNQLRMEQWENISRKNEKEFINVIL